MNYFTTRLMFLFVLAAPLLARAGGEEVVVIYNTNVPESKAIADHYAQARHVPKKQTYGFNLPTAEEISRAEFRDTLQLPLARKLEADGLWKLGPFTVPATNAQPERVGQRVIASKIRY